MVSLTTRVRRLLTEPLVTGPLILLLTRGPEAVREALLRVFNNARSLGDPNVNVSRTITALKWLFALGTVSRINRALTYLAVHNWTLRTTGMPWVWDGQKEIIVVTGGCSGFGALMVKGFAGKAKVVIVDIQAIPDDLKSLPGVHYYQCDLADSDQIAKQAAAIKSEVGAPTVLINNAGIGKGCDIIDSKPEWIEKIFRVNLISHWQLVQEFLPGMLKQKKGHIVSLASVASFVSVPSIVDYSSTKVGLLAFHEGLVAELRHKYENGGCIKTTIVHPTWARTALVNSYADALTAAKQVIIDPSIVANRIVKQVLKGQSGGQILIPSSVGILSTMRAWPHWLQELVRAEAAKTGQHI